MVPEQGRRGFEPDIVFLVLPFAVVVVREEEGHIPEGIDQRRIPARAGNALVGIGEFSPEVCASEILIDTASFGVEDGSLVVIAELGVFEITLGKVVFGLCDGLEVRSVDDSAGGVVGMGQPEALHISPVDGHRGNLVLRECGGGHSECRDGEYCNNLFHNLSHNRHSVH